MCDLIEAHDEYWEDDTDDAQHYEFTIEHQSSGLDVRRIGGVDYRTEGGALSVFAAGTIVESERIQFGPLHVKYLRLRGPLAVDMGKALGIHPQQPLILPAPPVLLPVAFAQTTQIVFDRQTGWQWALVRSLAELTRIIMTSCLEHPRPCHSERLVDRVRVLVEESSNRDWSVKELANVLGVRRASIWKAFKDQTGQAPAAWVRTRRMRVAQGMLARGLSVRQTAEYMGFSSRQHFARTFKAVTGHPPSIP